MRLEKFAPPVPKARLAEYMARFARGRAVLGRAGFRGEEAGANGNFKFEISDFKKVRNGMDNGNADSRSQGGEPGCRGGEQGGERGNFKLEAFGSRCAPGQDPCDAPNEPRDETVFSGQGHLKFENADLKFMDGETFDDPQRGSTEAALRDEHRADDPGAPAAAGKWREDRASAPACEIRLKGRVEGDQGQDLDLELNLDLKMDGERILKRAGGDIARTENASGQAPVKTNPTAGANSNSNENPNSNSSSNSNSNSNAKALTGFEANAFANLHAERTFCEGTEKHSPPRRVASPMRSSLRVMDDETGRRTKRWARLSIG
jgi:hypothetical protein